ncbi:hypothetical protein N9N67_03565 [Bacteriovoracaceae bacterium]|nr:hypothetical protein [Bacteriovoracaceae bacterium]
MIKTISCFLCLFAFSAFTKGTPGATLLQIEPAKTKSEQNTKPDLDQIQETIDPIQMKMIHDFVKKNNNCQLELGNSCTRTPSNRSVQ